MGWFQLGFFMSLLLSLIYIVLLWRSRTFKVFLAKEVFPDTMFGDALGVLLGKVSGPVSNTTITFLIFLLANLGIILLTIFVLTIAGYISVLVVLLLVLSLILGKKFKAKEKDSE